MLQGSDGEIDSNCEFTLHASGTFLDEEVVDLYLSAKDGTPSNAFDHLGGRVTVQAT